MKQHPLDGNCTGVLQRPAVKIEDIYDSVRTAAQIPLPADNVTTHVNNIALVRVDCDLLPFNATLSPIDLPPANASGPPAQLMVLNNVDWAGDKPLAGPLRYWNVTLTEEHLCRFRFLFAGN